MNDFLKYVLMKAYSTEIAQTHIMIYERHHDNLFNMSQYIRNFIFHTDHIDLTYQN